MRHLDTQFAKLRAAINDFKAAAGGCGDYESSLRALLGVSFYDFDPDRREMDILIKSNGHKIKSWGRR